MKNSYVDKDTTIGVWGIGHIGFSTMLNYADKGYNCIGYDIDFAKIKKLKEGLFTVDNLKGWIDVDFDKLLRQNKLQFTNNTEEIIKANVLIHFIAVPTENENLPFFKHLYDVIDKIFVSDTISNKKCPFIIIESTLSPNISDKILDYIKINFGLSVGDDFLFGVAPRRDWFISNEKNLKNLPRICGSVNQESTQILIEILSIVCDKVVSAIDYKHAEIVKSIENAIRQVEITLANQLMLSFPDFDMREILNLVSTKWNMPSLYPSLGIGGYCIPLASQYLLNDPINTDNLHILRTLEKSKNDVILKIVDILKNLSIQNVGILGLSYKGNIKIANGSPTITLSNILLENGISVKVNDPFYTPEEIWESCKTSSFQYPEELGDFDALIIVNDHDVYKKTNPIDFMLWAKKCKIIFDNVGIWPENTYSEFNIPYQTIGRAKSLINIK